jgi:hypothetical protein
VLKLLAAGFEHLIETLGLGNGTREPVQDETSTGQPWLILES